jgi:polyhydroxybutyrate depolymerase
MLVRVLGSIAILALLAGCVPSSASADGEDGATGVDQYATIPVGDLTRSYLLRTPDEVDAEPRPLLIMIHGAGGNAARAEEATGLTDAVAANDMLVAYPNGTAANSVEGELAWNAGACCGLARADRVDDVAFIVAMIADIQSQYAVDPERIYLAGYSNGGMLSYRLACEHAELFAGIAVVSGALNYTPCEPSRPLPVLIIHGTADATVPYLGGETNPRTASRFGQWENASVALATEFWRTVDDCDDDPVTTTVDLLTTDVYEGCADASALEVVTIADGTHTWPRLATADVEGSALILGFFGLGPKPQTE